MGEILKCAKCGEYTLKDNHCGAETITAKPAKWSPLDKYSSYRLKARMNELEKRGMI